jgi:hypothetical protein
LARAFLEIHNFQNISKPTLLKGFFVNTIFLKGILVKSEPPHFTINRGVGGERNTTQIELNLFNRD